MIQRTQLRKRALPEQKLIFHLSNYWLGRRLFFRFGSLGRIQTNRHRQ